MPCSLSVIDRPSRKNGLEISTWAQLLALCNRHGPTLGACRSSAQMMQSANESSMKPSILVPFDFSESAEAALKWASNLRASTSSPPIEIVHAIDLRPLVVADPPAVPTEDEIRGLDRMLQATAARLDIPARTRVIVGPSPIGDAIVDVAREEKVDLIVMGTHGKTGLRRLLLGSVAENVIRYAECPVLVVREPRAKAIGS